jgi:hypothetical protein
VKRITAHHDGHGRMEQIIVLATDEPATEPPGNSSHHRYEFFYRPLAYQTCAPGEDPVTVQEPDVPLGVIQFQRGPFDAPGSTSGVLLNAVLAALVDHLEGFQAGPLKSRETALTITKLEEAMFWNRSRADKRAAAGVLGTMETVKV